MAEHKKTLGQVAFEGLWRAQHDATGAGSLRWADVRPDVRLWWEAGAAAVKTAVLAEQAALTGPQGMAEQERCTSVAIRQPVLQALRQAEVDLTPTARLNIARAIEWGIMAGLRAWEMHR